MTDAPQEKEVDNYYPRRFAIEYWERMLTGLEVRKKLIEEKIKKLKGEK